MQTYNDQAGNVFEQLKISVKNKNQERLVLILNKIYHGIID